VAGEPQRVLDRRQRDVDDGHIQDDHELPETDDHKQRVRVAPQRVLGCGDRVHRRPAASRMYAACTTAARSDALIRGGAVVRIVSVFLPASICRPPDYSIVRGVSYQKFDDRRIMLLTWPSTSRSLCTTRLVPSSSFPRCCMR